MSQMARVFITLIKMATPNMLGIWIGVRIVMLAAAWFAGFVMKKIGRAPQDSPVIQIIREGVYEYGNRRMGLPSLGPRVMRGGGRRGRGLPRL